MACSTRIEYVLVAAAAGAAIGFGGSRLCSTCPSKNAVDAATLPVAFQPEKDKEKGEHGDHANGQHEGGMDMEQMQAEWDAYMKVGEKHQAMTKMAGIWKGDCTWYMGGPDDEPQKSDGTMTSTTLFGGRYLKHDFQGTWAGEPFQGIGYLAFDNAKQQYVSIWLDSMGTGIMYESGDVSADGTVWTMRGEFDWPGGGKVKSKSVTTVTGNTMVLEMYHDQGKGEALVGKIEYTKQ